MKKIILLLSAIILLSLTSTFSFAQKTYTDDDVIEHNGIFYDKFNEQPITGVIKYHYSNGNLAQRTHVKNGKRDGATETYQHSGQLADTEFYRNGKLIRRNRNSAQKTYDYYNDLVNRDGVLYIKSNNRPVTGIVLLYEEDIGSSTISKTSYKNGWREGLERNYNDNEELISKGNYKNDKQDGLWEYYHENGQLRSKGNYKNGEAEGLWKYYHENGNLENKTKYQNGKLEGVLEYYDRSGRLTKKELYRNGELVKTKNNFAKKTYPEKKVFRSNGIWYRTSDNRAATGMVIDYWENGNLESKVKYQNGRREGIAEYYDRSGRLTRKEIYKNDALVKSKEY